MRYREYAPHPALSPYVECFWSARDPEAVAGAVETILPDGCPEWIFHLDAPYRSAGPEPGAQPRSFLAGTTTGPISIETTGAVSTFGVRFRPAGVSAFHGVPLSELADAAATSEELWDGQGRRIEDAVRSAPDGRSRRHAVEVFLLSRLRPDRPARGNLDSAVAMILAARGAVSIAALADRLGTGRRRLERAFAAGVGVPPKTLARLARFQNALRRASGAPPRWAEVAAECGYADQAHLIREFREFSGETPGGLDAARGDLAPHFVDPERLDRMFESDVAFVQDGVGEFDLPSSARGGKP
jgi:AraC-like DNA-binding protein